MFRGILSTIYVDLNKGRTINNIYSELVRFYKNSSFVKVVNVDSMLSTNNVINTNNCEISICETRVKNKVIIFSALDNLVKGASGQAIQNMNLLYGFSETDGLK